ncbi:MAG: DUF533 domain-containing protein [Alphaproteobacteria bacterium]
MKTPPSPTVTESEFQMWRAVFALAHTDGMVTGGEIRFMAEALEDIPFSAQQKLTLNADIKNPKNVTDMFKSIEDPKDQAKFFKLAHEIVWADGEYSQSEQKILLELKSSHIRSTNIDDLVGKIDLEFEEPLNSFAAAKQKKKRNAYDKGIIFSFRAQFMKSRFGD